MATLKEPISIYWHSSFRALTACARSRPCCQVGFAGVLDHSGADMLMGEVKEVVAEFNQAATDPALLRAEFTRFCCCQPDHANDCRGRNERRQCSSALERPPVSCEG